MKKKVPLKVWKIQDQRSSAGSCRCAAPQGGGSILKQQKKEYGCQDTGRYQAFAGMKISAAIYFYTHIYISIRILF